MEPTAARVDAAADASTSRFNSYGSETVSTSSDVSVSAVELTRPSEPGAVSLADAAVVRWYMQNLESRPLQTKCWTSLSGFLIGDVTAQLLTEPTFVLSRTLILAGYGFFIDAPAGNAFYVCSCSFGRLLLS